METTKTIWVAQDKNTGDITAFEQEPQPYGFGHFWTSKSGHITPMRMFSTEIREMAKEKGINLENESMQCTITINI